MSAGDIWQWTMVGHGPETEEMVTTMHLVETEGSVSPGVLNIQAITEFVEGYVLTDYLGLIYATYTYEHSELKALTGLHAGLIGESYLNSNVPGFGTAAPSTIERCALITKDTGFGGRTGKGRIFAPMPAATWYTYDGLFDAGSPGFTFITAFTDMLLTQIATPQTFLASWALWHRAPRTATPIVRYEIAPRVGVQRRRREGIGS